MTDGSGLARSQPTPATTPTAEALENVPLPATRILKVPIYRQQHDLTCEAASLRMAIATLGKVVSEEALLAALERDPTPRAVLRDGSVLWGDPDTGFVGRWDGVFAVDGYGVYDGPIADLALSQGFGGTTHGSRLDPRALYLAVRQGFPAVVWVPYGLTVRGRGAWKTPGGKAISYLVTEHAVVLAGVDGQGILYADPLKPDLQRASFAAFEAAFKELENRAVIVRPNEQDLRSTKPAKERERREGE